MFRVLDVRSQTAAVCECFKKAKTLRGPSLVSHLSHSRARPLPCRKPGFWWASCKRRTRSTGHGRSSSGHAWSPGERERRALSLSVIPPPPKHAWKSIRRKCSSWYFGTQTACFGKDKHVWNIYGYGYKLQAVIIGFINANLSTCISFFFIFYTFDFRKLSQSMPSTESTHFSFLIVL